MKERSFYKNYVIRRIIAHLIMLPVIFLLLFYYQYEKFNENIRIIKENHINTEKAILENKVNVIVNFIRFKINKSPENIAEFKKDIIDMINTSNIDNKYYISVYELTGICLAHLNKDLIGKNVFEDEYSKKTNITKEKFDKFKKNPKDNFIVDKVFDIKEQKFKEKIMYAVYFKEFDWFIGSGVFIDNINQMILKKENIEKENLLKSTIILSLIVLLILGVIVIFSKKFLINIKNKLNEIIILFGKASNDLQVIDLSKFEFDEFKEIGQQLNKLIEQRKESEDLFKNFVHQSKDGIILVNQIGDIIELNEVICEIFENKRENLLNKKIWDMQFDKVPQEIKSKATYDRIKLFLTELLKYENPNLFLSPLEQRIEKKNKTIAHIQTLLFPIISENKVIMGGIIRDISEQKKIEESLSSEKERLAITLKSIADGVIVIDTDYKIILMNKSAEEITGFKSIDATGKNINQIYKISNEKLNNYVKYNIYENENEFSILIDKNGEEKLVTDKSSPIYDKNRIVIGSVLVFQNITEKKKTEIELQKAQKLESLGLVAGGIAHDFNNLLTGILGYISLTKNIAKDNEIISLLDKAEDATQQSKKLTLQLLTFSKGGDPVKKVISITPLIKNSLSFILMGSNIKYTFEEDSFLSFVEVDEGQITQVFNNIIVNAKEAMSDGGLIKVKAENFYANNVLGISNGDYIKITFEDNGTGIEEKNFKKIFDPYFTTKTKGNGLGLSICYSVVKKHNGIITVDSKLNQGTVFSIYLPHSNKNEYIRHIKEQKIIYNSGKVLVLDDEEVIRVLLSKMLKHLGYTSILTAKGEDTIEIYKDLLNKNEKPDVVILDLTIVGGMGGKDTIDELLKTDKNLKAIVSSGYSNDPIIANYNDYGFKNFLLKPYKLEELSNVLNSVLKGE